MHYKKLVLLFVFLCPYASLLSMYLDEEIYNEMRERVEYGYRKVGDKMPRAAFFNDAMKAYRVFWVDLWRNSLENLLKLPAYAPIKAVCQSIFDDAASQIAYRQTYNAALDATRNRSKDSKKLWNEFTQQAAALFEERLSKGCRINFNVINQIEFFKANAKFKAATDSIYLKSALFLLYKLKQVKKDAIAELATTEEN